MKKIFLMIFLTCLYSLCFGQEFLEVTQGRQLEFPESFYYQEGYRVQWWYFTGHLFDERGREFGYELTFFVVNVQQRDYKSRFGVRRMYISHFAVSDVAGNTFHFSDKAETGAYGFAGAENDRLRVWAGDNLLEGTVGKMHLKASDKDNAIDLQLIPVKPIVLHGEKGYSRKSAVSPSVASYYFSYTDLDTEGELKINNKTFRVRGKSWFDREISTQGLAETQAGWDWFAVQFDDKREVMLYTLRNKDGSTDRYSSGTVISPDGGYRHLAKDDFSVRILAYRKSGKTAARYPSQWEIKIPAEQLTMRITPLIADQEVLAYRTTGNHYWEGTCNVEGPAKGRAYVEMTGY
jgi:predicted secreted hydrolase